jgi:hypothetical protein
MLKWKIEDDNSTVDMIWLKDSLNVPNFKACLPRHPTLESIHKWLLSAMKWDMASIVLW